MQERWAGGSIRCDGAPLIRVAFPDAKTDAGQMFGGTAASGVLSGLGSPQAIAFISGSVDDIANNTSHEELTRLNSTSHTMPSST